MPSVVQIFSDLINEELRIRTDASADKQGAWTESCEKQVFHGQSPEPLTFL